MELYMYATFLLTSIATSKGGNLVQLKPINGHVIKGENITLTCSSNQTNWQSISKWKVTGHTKNMTGYITSDNSADTCSSENFLNQTDMYEVKCFNNNKVEVTIVCVDIGRHGEIWICTLTNSQNNSEVDSNNVTLYVNVPVDNVNSNETSSINHLKENTTASFRCVTSPCRPAATINWAFLDKQNTTQTVKYFESSKQLPLKENLTITESSIYVNVSRAMNGWSIRCNASNIQNYSKPTYSMKLNITYPTYKPGIQCTNNVINGTYKVIRNTKGKLTCTVDGGNPAGTLHWNCTGNVTDGQVQHYNVTQTVVWNANQTQWCTCYSTNIAGNSSTTVRIDVLYPPVIEEIQNITVFEGDTVTLRCNVTDANPSVYKISWTSNKHNPYALNATFTISNISRSDDKVYACTANNSMNTTCQGYVQGSTSKDLHVEILYPPYVNVTRENNFTVKEGDMFNYTCPVVHGNPSTINITWRRCSDTKIWSSPQLLIYNVTRHDDSIYKCYAAYQMENSYGTVKTGSVEANITLNVNFKTDVTDFYIRGYQNDTNVIVMENERLLFQCRLQSNPTANVRIFQTETLVNSSKANELIYNTTASCTGGPVNYSCHWNNSLNNISSTRLLDLFVNCIPRANMNADEHFYVTSAINQTVTLSYTVLAYPHPSFVWYRNSSSINTSDSRITVSSTNLHINFTIIKVEERDFGEYTLNVTNGHGSINESFYLKPNGIPEVPNHLKQDESSTTISVVGLYWRSGFKNGSEQIFTLMYSKLTEEKWYSANVSDIGQTGTTIHYNITGLSNGTSYEIVLFAVNAKGRSKYNATLTCSTKQKNYPTDHSSIIGATAGSAAGLLLIGVVVAGIVIVRRRMVNKPPDGPDATASLYENDTNDKKTVFKHGLNPLVVPNDRGIYENAELGKRKNQSQKSSGGNLSQSGEYVKFAKQKPDVKQMVKQDELSMRTMSPDIIATTQKSTASKAPPPIPSKTEFAGVLCKVDDDEDHEDNNAHANDENIYSNSSEKIKRIENVFVHELLAFVAGKSFEQFATEFYILPNGLTMPCTVAVKPENIKLNRFNGIFPYDHSRVTIHNDPDFFINACYMDGYMEEKFYIASLGPTADTSSGFKTFWKMVWHEQSDIIIMVTNLREITGMKCEQYWPKFGTSKVYGEVTVTCRNVEEYADYTVRTFSVSKTSHNRTVTQLHFTAWPDKGVPDDITSLLEFRQRLKSTPNLEPGPIIVHCSAGIGRTGTFIALDRLIAEGKATQSINVSTCVRSMRQQRVNMVQTQEQYVYIYKACVYALAFECDCISAETFHDNLKATSDAQFGELFKNLKTVVDNESDDEKKAILKNKQDKSNRPTADIPGDRYRVRLYVDKNAGDSDYTNAVYINSFKTKDRFIAAQTPLNKFVQDFICMIFQEQCVCVVDMDGNTPSKLDVGAYIPTSNQSFSFGNFTISSDKLDSNTKYTINKVKIENTGKFYMGERTLYHFQYHNWNHGEEAPTDPRDFVEFVKEVDDYATTFGGKKSHVLVHCLDASKKSGLFCFVACLLEKIQCEREVNVGNTLRQVRTRRKRTINTANNLKFCFKTVDAFVEMNKAK